MMLAQILKIRRRDALDLKTSIFRFFWIKLKAEFTKLLRWARDLLGLRDSASSLRSQKISLED